MSQPALYTAEQILEIININRANNRRTIVIAPYKPPKDGKPVMATYYNFKVFDPKLGKAVGNVGLELILKDLETGGIKVFENNFGDNKNKKKKHRVTFRLDDPVLREAIEKLDEEMYLSFMEYNDNNGGLYFDKGTQIFDRIYSKGPKPLQSGINKITGERALREDRHAIQTGENKGPYEVPLASASISFEILSDKYPVTARAGKQETILLDVDNPQVDMSTGKKKITYEPLRDSDGNLVTYETAPKVITTGSIFKNAKILYQSYCASQGRLLMPRTFTMIVAKAGVEYDPMAGIVYDDGDDEQ